MKILIAVEHYFPYIGGAEKLHQSIAESLIEDGHTVDIITTRFSKDLSKFELINGVRIHRIPLTNRFAFTFLGWFWMIKLAFKSQLIQTASYNAAFPAFLAGLISRKPVVVTFHEVWAELWSLLPYLKWWERRAFHLYENMLLKLPFKKFIVVSEHTKSQLIQNGVAPNRVVRIYNGIDYSKFDSPAPQHPKHFTPIYFARLGPSKGLDLLLSAWSNFIVNHPNTQLKLVIPTYPKRYFNAIQKQIQTLGIASSIQIFHELSKQELQSEILTSSCVVIPSYAEGFCFAAVESAALNLPIISSNQGALKETVSGKVIRLNTLSEAELETALLRASQGEFDMVPTRKFELQKQVDEYIQLYQSIVE